MPDPIEYTATTATTAPIYTPNQVRDWFADAPDNCPKILAPLHLLIPLVKQRIGVVEKQGTVKPREGEKGPTYDFLRIADVLVAAHDPLIEYGIHWRKIDAEVSLTADGRAQTCKMRATFVVTGPLGDTVTIVAVSQATDWGSDKAVGKASTACRKDMLLDLFAVATGDPDDERPERTDRNPAHVPASDTQVGGIVQRIKALPEGARGDLKAWTDERGISVRRGITVADLNRVDAWLTSVERRLARPVDDATASALADAMAALTPERLERLAEGAETIYGIDLADVERCERSLTVREHAEVREILDRLLADQAEDPEPELEVDLERRADMWAQIESYRHTLDKTHPFSFSTTVFVHDHLIASGVVDDDDDRDLYDLIMGLPESATDAIADAIEVGLAHVEEDLDERFQDTRTVPPHPFDQD